MQQRYLSLSPFNLVRLILGERRASDNPASNVYTRAAAYLNAWECTGILAREPEPALFPYYQHFTVPDTGERLVRKGFIALGPVVEYAASIVHRHEQTLSGPKQDRLELLRHTHGHFGQIFMLYADPVGAVDALLDDAAEGAPLAEVTDEYGAIHRLWKLTETEPIQELMSDQKLLIADGHHRYETALAFRKENPGMAGTDRVMMTFVNMHSPGLRILATHRLVNSIPAEGFPDEFLRIERGDLEIVRGGAAIGDRLFAFEARDAVDQLDVRVLHERLLGRTLGIGEEAVRDEKHLRYVRGLDAAVEAARQRAAQIAFLLRPVSVEQVAKISFAGGVMPQKSTDFYPKLLSGLTIYKLD